VSDRDASENRVRGRIDHADRIVGELESFLGASGLVGAARGTPESGQCDDDGETTDEGARTRDVEGDFGNHALLLADGIKVLQIGAVRAPLYPQDPQIHGVPK
jgi:hypothetical protein